MKTNQIQKKLPKDWNHVILGDFVNIFNGGAFSSEDSSIVGIRWIKIANVGIQNIKWEAKSFLPEKFLSEHEQYKLKERDIIVALTRPTLEGKLKIARIQKKDSPSLLNQRVGKLIFKNSVSPEFGYYFLILDKVAYKINQLLAGSDPPNLSSNAFNYINLNLPPLPEQFRIVAVLETWDEAIEKLKKKIEIKKQIKKGLMRDLLTGNKRLEGFKNEWQEKKLGEISSITTGSSNREDSSLDGEFTFFDRSEDIRTSNIYLFDGEAVIIAGEGQRFIPKYFVGKFDLHQRTYAIMNFIETDSKYIYYYLHQNKNYLLAQAVGSTVKSLRLPMFTNMKILIPEHNEQKSIALILTTADEEINLLKSKLKHLEDQKKYLLNNLITGEIRTPENLLEKVK